METIIIGGDARFECLARLLSERGESVGVYGRDAYPGVKAVDRAALGRADIVVMNCPVRLGLTLEDVLAMASPGTRVFACGPGHPQLADERVADLWKDEALLHDNARLTAEGALASAMRASSRALIDLRCLIVGWGRIGQALAELLVAMGARVTVASRTSEKRNRAAERGAEAVDSACIADALPGQGLIFNTAPAMVLDGTALRRADPDALLIELASPPYGIDLRAAWARGLRAWREPGLPGRHCPQSAAIALLKAIDRSKDGRRAI